MKKLLLLLLLLPALSFGTQWGWDGGHATSGKWSEPTNWTADSDYPRLSTDTVLLNNTSVDPCTLDVSPSIAQFTIASNYSGFFVMTGRTMTCAYGFSDDGITSAHNYGNGITFSTTHHFGSGIAVPVASNCVITATGAASVIDDDKGLYFNSLVIGSGAYATISGAAESCYQNSTGPVLTFVNGGGLAVNKVTDFNLIGTGNYTNITGAPTINGTANINFQSQGVGSTVSLPAFAHTGTGTIVIWNSVTTTTRLTGNLSVGAKLEIVGYTANIHTFNTQNFSTASVILNMGNVTAGGTFNYNLGSSTISCTAFNSTVYNGGTTNGAFGTATVNCSGNFAFGSNHNITHISDIVTLNGTGAQTITSNGKSFYDLTMNNSGSAIATAVSLADSLTCNDLTLTDGPWNSATYGIRCADLVHASADSTRYQRVWMAGDYLRGAGATKSDTSGQHLIFLAGTSHVAELAGKTYAQITINAPTAFSGGGTIRALSYGVDGVKGTLASGTTTTLDNLGIGGTDGHPDTLRSGTPGSAATLAFAGAQKLARSYLVVADITLTAGDTLDLQDGTSVNLGGNSGAILWPASPVGSHRGNRSWLGLGIWLRP